MQTEECRAREHHTADADGTADAEFTEIGISPQAKALPISHNRAEVKIEKGR